MNALVWTVDLPPRRGGAARYHAAVVAALGAAALAPPPHRHWTTLLPWIARRVRTQHITHLIVGELLPLGTVAWVLRLLGGPPYVVICHGLDLRLAARIPRRRWLARHILRHAHRVIANSAATDAIARSLGAPNDRVTIIHPPIGITPAIATAHPPRELRPLILSVGRLVRRKGFDTLISAVAQLAAERPTLVIIGDGPERDSLRTLAEELRVDVRIITDADDGATAAWYATCDAFALLPRELPNGDVEGFGIVYLEAGVFGKPVVGTRSGGVPEAVLENETGLLVPPDDPAAAAAAISRLIADRGLAHRLGTTARTRAKEFSQERFAERLRLVLMA